MLPESPVQMFFQGKVEEGRKSVEQLAKLNGKTFVFDPAEFEEHEGKTTFQDAMSNGTYATLTTPALSSQYVDPNGMRPS